MKYLILIAFVAFSPFFAFAALDVVYSGTSTISAGGQSVIVGDGGTVDSITVDTNSFDIVFSGGATVSLTNSSGNEISAPVGNNISKTTSCSGGSAVITLKQETAVSGTNTVTATPLSTSCQTAAVSSNASAGGGLVHSSPAVQVAQAQVSVQPQQSQLAPAPLFIEFKLNLRYGMKNNDVTRLQELLAGDSAIYPEGTISGYFGSKTLAAVKRFQNRYGISQIGTVGPLTRAKLKEVFGVAKSISIPVTTPLNLPSASSDVSNQVKVKELLQQLKILQEQLKILQRKS